MNRWITSRLIASCWCAVLLAAGATASDENVRSIAFDSSPWVIHQGEVVEHLGRQAFTGSGVLDGAHFTNGVIEVDLALTGERSYPGIAFRIQTDSEYEKFYVRPHRAGLYPDALQYAPTFHGESCWQLYSGEGFTAPAALPSGEWIPVRLEVLGTQARVFLHDRATPALSIPDLKRESSDGDIGLSDLAPGRAYFSNLRVTQTDTLDFPPPPRSPPRPYMLMDWEISRAFTPAQLDPGTYPDFFVVFGAEWRAVTAEPNGLVNLSRLVDRRDIGPARIIARTLLQCTKPRNVDFTFGYSDDVTVFLNGRRLYSGQSGYRSRDPSYVGVIGLFDSVQLSLEVGLNELCLIVSDGFGGWGFTGRTDKRLSAPALVEQAVTKVWETPDVFRVPESVLYDAARDVLYVSSFDRVGRTAGHTGFISKLSPQGRIEELEWATGLDGPCGMGLVDTTLYVVECSGHLVAIDTTSGAILARYPTPGSSFLNDVAVGPHGDVYISNTSRAPQAIDLYRFHDGEMEVWKDGYELHRSNGLFVQDHNMVVGCTGSGHLKSVDLESGHVSTITSLGAGVIDGIRADNTGNLLVSHWEGKLYRITPAGEVSCILDTSAQPLNLADFEFIRDRNLLVVPTFLGNKVVAFELTDP